jgi:hypothetical protein
VRARVSGSRRERERERERARERERERERLAGRLCPVRRAGLAGQVRRAWATLRVMLATRILPRGKRRSYVSCEATSVGDAVEGDLDVGKWSMREPERENEREKEKERERASERECITGTTP